MKRNSKLGFVTSLHFALFALIVKPTDGTGWIPATAFGGFSALLLGVALFYEASV